MRGNSSLRSARFSCRRRRAPPGSGVSPQKGSCQAWEGRSWHRQEERPSPPKGVCAELRDGRAQGCRVVRVRASGRAGTDVKVLPGWPAGCPGTRVGKGTFPSPCPESLTVTRLQGRDKQANKAQPRGCDDSTSSHTGVKHFPMSPRGRVTWEPNRRWC